MKNPISRRTFGIQTAAAGLAALGLSSRSHGDDSTEPAPPGTYVDIHTHITQDWIDGRPALSAKGMLEWMDVEGISHAAVLPLTSPESWFYPISSGYVLKETAAHRDRLIPFCHIDPRTVNLNYGAKRDLLMRYRDAGARGFGEHKVGMPIDDPRNMEIFRACAEAGLPVLFHLDTMRNTDTPGLPGLEKVLQENPDGIFIGHAQGWWASISGDVTQEEMQGYPNKPTAPGGAIDRLMETYPNIYGDLSAGSGANAILRDKAFGRDFLERRADRLLFGTDYLAPKQKVPQFSLYNSIDLPEAAKAKIYRENARRILGV